MQGVGQPAAGQHQEGTDLGGGAVLTLVTAASTRMLDHFGETVSSVRRAAAAVGAERVRWRICLDGADEVPRAAATLLDGALADGVADAVLAPGGPYGVSAARNCAAAGAHTPWLLPLDADDVVDPAGLAALVGVLGTAGPDVAWVGTRQGVVGDVDDPRARERAAEAAVVRGQRHYGPGELNVEFTWPMRSLHPNAVALRTEVLWSAGGWPAICGSEDLVLLLRVAREHAGLVSGEVAVHRRFWDGQTTRWDRFRDDEVRRLRHELFDRLDILGGRQRDDRGMFW